MKYVDSGTRDPASALGYWLNSELPTAAALRIQSGFYGGEVSTFLSPALVRLRDTGGPVCILVGSNEQKAVASDVADLADLLGVPRERAGLGVVSYAGAFFHPKVYHLVREDGSACAYVGSANLTSAGVIGRHVEAGVLLDSRDGDDPGILGSICQAIEEWFDRRPEGLYLISGQGDVQALLEAGILRDRPAPRERWEDIGEAKAGTHLVRLKPLFELPSLQLDGEEGVGEGAKVPEELVPEPLYRPVSTRPGLPGYILMAAGLTTPATDEAALTGVPLPSGAVGLVLQLNRDSARHFFQGPGTSNITIPVATLATIRFGEYHGKYVRPRAEFTIRYRYLHDKGTIGPGQATTNIMAYGFDPDEKGHGDVRMLVPAGVKAIAGEVGNLGLKPPGVGDPALLEWPSDSRPEFRLTYLDPASGLAATFRNRLETALAGGHAVGEGATWMMPTDSLPW